MRWCWLVDVKTRLHSRRIILRPIRWPLCECRPIIRGYTTTADLLLAHSSDCHVISWCTSIILLFTNSRSILMVVIAAGWMRLLIVVPLHTVPIIVRHVWHAELWVVAWGGAASVRATLYMTITQRNINRPKSNWRRLIQIPISASAIYRGNLREIWMIQILSFHHVCWAGTLCALILKLVEAGRHLLMLLHVRTRAALVMVGWILRLHRLLFLNIHFLGLFFDQIRIWKVLVRHLEGARCCCWLLLLLMLGGRLLLLSFSILLCLSLILLS